MKVFAKSDIGRAREMNQDAYYASQPSDTVGLYIVADGMGGHKGGRIASSLAIEEIKKFMWSFCTIFHFYALKDAWVFISFCA